MRVDHFVSIIGADFYTGVPDSQLKALCDYLYNEYGIDQKHHIIAANEGNAVGLAAGYYLSTGKVPVVYMQNSGEGNAINPLASLLNENVYAIPCIFIIGWRGEPGVHDEPQHVFQGEVTCRLLEDMNVAYEVITQDTSDKELLTVMQQFNIEISNGHSVAFVVKKGALEYDHSITYENSYSMNREQSLKYILKAAGNDLVISTTGKISREIYEIRDNEKQDHKNDFLTVGSMGHCSSIALGVAINIPNRRVWCIDGDGAVLMHMGAMAVIANCKPQNMIHIIINNGAHDTVGGQPTVMRGLSVAEIGKACGYPYCVTVSDYDSLNSELVRVKENNCLSLIEVKCALGSRKDLGRPKTRAIDNKKGFMSSLNGE